MYIKNTTTSFGIDMRLRYMFAKLQCAFDS